MRGQFQPFAKDGHHFESFLPIGKAVEGMKREPRILAIAQLEQGLAACRDHEQSHFPVIECTHQCGYGITVAEFP